MSFDISHLLDGWNYEPGQIAVRKFTTQDGLEKIQLRVDLGLLQMNIIGRPDGKRPYGKPSLLDYHEARLRRYMRTHDGADDGFRLSPEDCGKLQQEAIQFHHRYICLFQLQDYRKVLRDAERNLRAIEFIRKFGSRGETIWPLQQLVPQLYLLRTRARAMLAVESDDHASAVNIAAEGLESLRDFYQNQARPDLADHSGELQSLESFLRSLEESRPLSKREQLEQALAAAIRREDYEKAAQLRDRLRSLTHGEGV